MYLSDSISIRAAILCIGLFVFLSSSIFAETQYFQFTSNTGNNATIILPLELQPVIEGDTLEPGDEIGVFTQNGLCVGAIVWKLEAQSITIWGNNEETPALDGIEPGDSIYFRVWRQSTNTEYQNILVRYSDAQPFYNTSGKYSINGIYLLRSFLSFPAPNAPELTSPPDNAIDLDTTVTLEWSRPAMTDSFNLQVARDSGFSDIVTDEREINNTRFELTGLSYRTDYFWRVSGRNLAGDGEWSAVRNFSTLNVPPAPVLISPENEADGIAVSIILQWETTVRTDTYNVQVSTDIDFSNLIIDESGIESNSFEATGLDYGLVYYWRVSSTNVAGDGDWSEIRNFSTLNVPPAPVLISPENEADGIAVGITLHWEPTVRTDTYNVQISTDIDFSNLIIDESGVESNSFEATGLNYGVIYYWRVSSTNQAGTGTWSEIRQFSTIDRGISFQYPSQPTVWIENSIQTIRWQILGVELLTIEYSIDGGNQWLIIEESVDAGTGEYAWTVPSTPSTAAFIKLTDAAHENVSALSEVFSIYPRQIPVSHSLNFGDPSLVTSYRMIGLPGNNNLPLSSVMSGNHGTDWTAFWDNGSSQDYLIEYNNTDTFNFRPGRGFWILGRSNFNYQSNQSSVELNSDNAYDIPLHNGWNIITNPFNIEISWSAVQSHNDISAPIWEYNGSFVQRGSMQPYTGYYFHNNGNLPSLSIPYPNSGTLSKQSPTIPEITRHLNIYLKTEETVLSDIAIGIANEYNENIDRYSVYAPPSDFEIVGIRIRDGQVHTEFRNPSEDGYTFDIQIRTNDKINYAIQIEGTETFGEYEIILVHRGSGKIIEITDNSNVPVSQTEGTEKYKLIVGNSEFINKELEKLKPEEVRLAQNYPNPFNPVTTIEYSIPEQTEPIVVTIEIFNILGQKVRTLVNEYHTAGFYSVEWNARNDRGVSVPSGLYIYRLNAGSRTISNRMLLLK